MSADAQVTEYAGQAKRAAVAVIEANGLPIGLAVSYDVLVGLVALGWIEGRLSATDEQLATLSTDFPGQPRGRGDTITHIP